MSDLAIHLENVGKLYKLYRHNIDKVLDAFGINRWLFWRKDIYQGFWALRGLDLEVKKGERLGIIGRNGAGKSTLLKIITGNITPTEGVVRVRGRIQALLELGTGFHPEFTGRRNIWASLAYQGFSPAQIREKEEEVIDFAELEEFIDQPVKTYSAGMYARLAFATATVIDPEILIIDEVLGAGDAYFAGKCVERMRRLTEDSGATVLFVSHDLGSVQRLCGRAIWIDRGRLVQDGEPLAIIKSYGARVRLEEAIRLRARDLKVLKKQAILLDRHEDIYERLLFHLVGADGASPPIRSRIFCLRLFRGEEEIGAIQVGSPLDNSPEHLHYVMDTPRYMDWGPPQKDAYGMYREYGDFKGKYRHAPFEFAVPKTIAHDGRWSDLCLEVDAEMSIDNVVVEAYDQRRYVRLGCLPVGPRRITRLPLPGHITWSRDPEEKRVGALTEPGLNPSEPVTSPAVTGQGGVSEHGTGEAKIVAVHLYDHLGEASRVFEVGKPIKVVLEYEAYTVLRNPVFVFCVYLADGQCFTQWIVTAKQLGRQNIYGKGRVVFHAESLVMGRASYVASAAIFKYLSPDGQEAESYHLLDRCIHFQIIQETGDILERGLCLQPFKAYLEND
jgi:lipopolysaccharide transport system ATP-binding protein